MTRPYSDWRKSPRRRSATDQMKLTLSPNDPPVVSVNPIPLLLLAVSLAEGIPLS